MAASCALVGTIAPQPSQAAVFTYNSAPSVTTDSDTLSPALAISFAQLTKVDNTTNLGLFDYQVKNFRATLVPLNLSLSLDGLYELQNAVLVTGLNTIFAQIPAEFQKYNQINLHVQAGVGDPGSLKALPIGHFYSFIYSFSNQDVLNGVNLAIAQLPTFNLPATETAQFEQLLNAMPTLFPNGGTARVTFHYLEPPIPVPPVTSEASVISLESTSTAAPEPTTIAGLALAGGALAAARRHQKQRNVDEECSDSC